MSRRLGDLGAGPFGRDFLLQAGRHAGVIGLDRRLDGADLDQRHAELALDGLADVTRGKRERGIRNRGIEDGGFADHAEIDIGRFEIALLGEVLERQSCGDAIARRLRLGHVREDDLRYLALLRGAVAIAALREQLLGVLVGNVGPFGDFLRRDRDVGDLAIFGRAELGLVLVEIAGERLRRGRIDLAGLGGAQPHEFDGALLVLETAQRFQQGFRRLEAGRDGAGDLAPQRDPLLVGDVACFGEAVLANDGLEALRIEAPADAFEVRVGIDHPQGLRIGLSKPQPPGLLVQRRFGQGLLQHLAVKAERPRLIHRQRTAELAADLLQLVGVELAELVDRDFGMADGRQRRLPEAPENIGDAPDAETDDQDPHHHGHNGFAEPV